MGPVPRLEKPSVFDRCWHENRSEGRNMGDALRTQRAPRRAFSERREFSRYQKT